MTRIALLDDYHNLALSLADWSKVKSRASWSPSP